MKNHTDHPKKTTEPGGKWSLRLYKISLLFIASCAVILSAFTIVPIAGAVASLICPYLDGRCSMDRYGPMLFGVGSLIYLVVSSTLAFHYIAKIRWLVSLEIGLTALGFYYVCMSTVSSIFQHHMYSVFAVGLVLMFFFAFFLHTFIFLKLKKWPLIGMAVASTLFVGYVFVVPPLLYGFTQSQHKALQDGRDLEEARALTFQVYAPSYVSGEYTSTWVNAYAATPDGPQSYSLAYSNQPITHTANAKTIHLDQRESAEYSPPSVCDYLDSRYYKSNSERSTCSQIGQTNNCTIYQLQRPQSSRSCCMIGKTLITMEIYKKEVSQEEIVKIFDSMEPADVAALQQRAIESREGK